MAEEEKNDLKGNPFAGCIRVIRLVTLFFTVCSALSFVAWVLGIYSLKNIPRLFSHGINTAQWPALVAEIQMYEFSGFDISWLGSDGLEQFRRLLWPYSQYIDLLLLRFFGLGSVFVPLLAVCVTTFCSGRIDMHRRRERFIGPSSTQIHIYSQLRYLCYALISFFLSFPFGSEFPVLGYIPIYKMLHLGSFQYPLWFSSPSLLFVLVAIPMGFVAFQFGRHLPASDI